MNRRLVLAAKNANAEEVFEELKRERNLLGTDEALFGRVNVFMVQTGLRFSVAGLATGAFFLGVFFFIFLGFFIGYGVLAFVGALITPVAIIVLALWVIRNKRIERFSSQLPDALDVIVRGVKAGYPFLVALGLVAKEMPDPIGTEFGMTADEISFGAPLGTALDNFYRRVGHDDLLYMTMAVKVQSETGGNLAEILSRLSKLIRDRSMLRLKIKSLSAEGRLSAVLLSLFPFIIIAVISLISPNFYGAPMVRNSPITSVAIVVGLFLLAVGNFIIYRMVRFKV